MQIDPKWLERLLPGIVALDPDWVNKVVPAVIKAFDPDYLVRLVNTIAPALSKVNPDLLVALLPLVNTISLETWAKLIELLNMITIPQVSIQAAGVGADEIVTACAVAVLTAACLKGTGWDWSYNPTERQHCTSSGEPEQTLSQKGLESALAGTFCTAVFPWCLLQLSLRLCTGSWGFSLLVCLCTSCAKDRCRCRRSGSPGAALRTQAMHAGTPPNIMQHLRLCLHSRPHTNTVGTPPLTSCCVMVSC